MRRLNFISIVGALTLTACGAPFTYAGDSEGTDASDVGTSDDAGETRDVAGDVVSKDVDALDEMNVNDALSDVMVNVEGSAGDAADAATCVDTGSTATLCLGDSYFVPGVSYCSGNTGVAMPTPVACMCDYTCDCFIAANVCAQGVRACGASGVGGTAHGIQIECN